MATKQITTWDEFKTALTETITENTTYELQNDIDVSDTVIESTIYIYATSYRKTVNGNGHKINGITSYMTGTNACVFSVSSTAITFNSLSFTNFMVQSASLFFRNGSGGTNTYFNECYFNGLAKCVFYESLNSNKCSFNCAFDVNNMMIRNGNHSNAYIIVDGTKYANTNNSACYPIFGIFTNCYIGGTTKYVSNNAQLLNGRYEDCVININFKNSEQYPKTTGSLTLSNSAPTTGKYALVNFDKIEKNDNVTWNTLTGTYDLTDSQLKSKTYIQGNTHFPLQG